MCCLRHIGWKHYRELNRNLMETIVNEFLLKLLAVFIQTMEKGWRDNDVVLQQIIVGGISGLQQLHVGPSADFAAVFSFLLHEGWLTWRFMCWLDEGVVSYSTRVCISLFTVMILSAEFLSAVFSKQLSLRRTHPCASLLQWRRVTGNVNGIKTLGRRGRSGSLSLQILTCAAWRYKCQVLGLDYRL